MGNKRKTKIAMLLDSYIDENKIDARPIREAKMLVDDGFDLELYSMGLKKGENTGDITITQDDFLIVYFIRDAKMDFYRLMILSDNIVFPHEFATYLDTTKQQIHQASVQTLENQSNITSNTSYQTTQHNRSLTPTLRTPQSALTAGNNNTYWDGNNLVHGKTSYGNTRETMYAILPEDYVDASKRLLNLSKEEIKNMENNGSI